MYGSVHPMMRTGFLHLHLISVKGYCAPAHVEASLSSRGGWSHFNQDSVSDLRD